VFPEVGHYHQAFQEHRVCRDQWQRHYPQESPHSRQESPHNLQAPLNLLVLPPNLLDKPLKLQVLPLNLLDKPLPLAFPAPLLASPSVQSQEQEWFQDRPRQPTQSLRDVVCVFQLTKQERQGGCDQSVLVLSVALTVVSSPMAVLSSVAMASLLLLAPSLSRREHAQQEEEDRDKS
jgi:hypothetical protein